MAGLGQLILSLGGYMDNFVKHILAVGFLSIMVFFSIAEAQAMQNELNKKQQQVVTIAAYTANGDLEKLQVALNEGLDAGLTVNEVKEILIQLYAYTGFPRSLNGINTFMAVMDARQAKGIKDEVGKAASPVAADLNRDDYGSKVRAKLAGQTLIPPASGYQLFAPTIDTFLKEHLFADIFVRDVLDFQTRELATISALAALSGTAGQLQFHMGASMNMGLTAAQMKHFVTIIETKVGKPEGKVATSVLEGVLKARN